MKNFLIGLYYSFPVQLVLLHFKRFQVLLLFWVLLFYTVGGSFMNSYGADSLFLAPEYLGQVSFASAAIMGFALGVYIMSWNITTFILFSRHFRFLATTSNPFLKYCINNAVIPLLFLAYYFVQTIRFASIRELMSASEIIFSVAGFMVGMALLVMISFLYFFRADKSIIRTLAPVMSNPKLFKQLYRPAETRMYKSRAISVEWYLNARLGLKKTRDVSHYSREFIETIFNRHHLAAIISIVISFLFLILLGFFLDSPYFQLPAAASITVFFAILIALSGAFSYFFQTWSIPILLLLLFGFNLLYQYRVFDPGNRAYGLNYLNRDERPEYSKEAITALCTSDKVERDKKIMLEVLEKWKAKQKTEKPYLFIINTSGGGTRSATFTMNVLQRLDSLSQGELMDKTFMITGASGGMLGASYFRELDRRREQGINPADKKYVDDISHDLLNAIFISFVARDMTGPAQKFEVGRFSYIKDRGYAFEQKLNENTRGMMNRQLREVAEDERQAKIPLMMLNSVVTRDGRKMIISTLPVSFLMRPIHDSASTSVVEPDAIDFGAMFQRQDPMNMRLLTALRMNATFPYVLPNVWLPSEPVIDVMDAGLRDNYGPEVAVRFIEVFDQWIRENTSGVVLLQIRDRLGDGWDHPYESTDVTEIFTKPLLILQHNWYKMQDYNQNDLLSLMKINMGDYFQRISFKYIPVKEDAGAALNFHLTKREKRNISEALDNETNSQGFTRFSTLVTPPKAAAVIAERR